jgi:hypothetical protein
MSETNEGANLMFAHRTTNVCEPMPEANVYNSFSNIGLMFWLLSIMQMEILFIYHHRHHQAIFQRIPYLDSYYKSFHIFGKKYLSGGLPNDQD